MAEERVAREENETINKNNNTNNNSNLNYVKKEGENEGIGSGGSSTTITTTSSKTTPPKGKSCKGCLYYSSTLKSNARNPLCVGLTRSLPQVPRYIVGESEMEASKEGRSLTDFRYACIGYSVYPDGKNHSGDTQDSQTELPVCVGIEVLVDRRVTSAETAPAHMHNREDGHAVPQRRTHKPAHSVGDEFLSRFTRNANLVAMGVAKNLRKVGNHIKESVDDILYPYRRRPK